MKALQLFALILALGVAPAFAQQEVDPDHFDQPAAKAAVQKSHVSHVSAQRHQHNQTMASNHGGKAHHHHSHTAA